MALTQIKVPVASSNGACISECGECASARGIIDKDKTVAGDGILRGAVVARTSDNLSKWVEGCQCYVNFQYDDAQLVSGVILKPCDIALVCGPVVDYIDGIVLAPLSPSFVWRHNDDGSWDLMVNGVAVANGPVQFIPNP